ncbi:MAG: acyltransferase [bacterium]
MAFDDLKAFVIVLVVLHHSLQAYTTYARYDFSNYVFSTWPVVDSARSYAFDLFQRFNDLYFMSLLFFVSGLFTWPSLNRKGAGEFLKDRFLRLGVPFAIGVTLLAPLGEYPAYLVTGHEPGFFHFWFRVFFINHWYSGPVWFLWVLLFFSLVLVFLRACASVGLALFFAGVDRLSKHPYLFIGITLGLTFFAYALLFLVWPYTDLRSWMSNAGPFWVQLNRVLVYFCFFLGGVAMGKNGIASAPLLQREGAWAKKWVLWWGFAFIFYTLSVWQGEGGVLGWKPSTPFAKNLLSCAFFASVCTFASVGMVSFFARFMNFESAFWGSLSENSYAIYLVHFPIVVGLQYGLLPFSLPVFLKLCVVVLGGWGLSWMAGILLRRLPGLRRVL